MTKRRMEESLIVLLGGRAAEQIVLDDITTGASNDIERATGVARDMVMRYGFSEKLGPILYGSEDHEVFLGRDYGQAKNYSENVASEIDAEIREIIETAYERAKDIITEHRDLLDRVTNALIKQETIDGPDFYKLMNGEIDVDGEPVEQESALAEPAAPAEPDEDKTETADDENGSDEGKSE